MKDHLLSNNYEWSNSTAGIMPADGPTRRRFDRFNGDCVLHMLNLFDRYIAALTVAEGQKIENLLQQNLPLDTRSELSVFNWLKEMHSQNALCEVI